MSLTTIDTLMAAIALEYEATVFTLNHDFSESRVLRDWCSTGFELFPGMRYRRRHGVVQASES